MNIIVLQAITRKLHEIFNERRDKLSEAGYEYDTDREAQLISARLSLVVLGCLNIFYTRNKDALKNAREIDRFLEDSEFYIAKDSSNPGLLFGFSFGADSDIYASEKLANLIASPEKSDINFTEGDLDVLEELGHFVANVAVTYRTRGMYLYPEACYNIDSAISGKDKYAFNFRDIEDINLLSERLGDRHVLLAPDTQMFEELKDLDPNYLKAIFDRRKDGSLELEF